TDWSPHGYGWFGIVMGSIFHRYEEGYRWAKAAYALMERSYPGVRTKAEFFMEIASIWTQPLDAVIEHARIAVRTGLDAGDLPIACWSSTHILSYRLLRGDPLEELDREVFTSLGIVRTVGVRDSLYVALDIQRYVRAMQGVPFQPDAGTAVLDEST